MTRVKITRSVGAMITREILEEFFSEELSERERNTLKRGYWSEKIFRKFMAFYKTLSEKERQATVKDYFDGVLNEVWDEVVRGRQN